MNILRFFKRRNRAVRTVIGGLKYMGQDDVGCDQWHVTGPHIICPDCAGTQFYEGPRGCGAVNIECANCGSRFNFATSLNLLDRIPRADG